MDRLQMNCRLMDSVSMLNQPVIAVCDHATEILLTCRHLGSSPWRFRYMS